MKYFLFVFVFKSHRDAIVFIKFIYKIQVGRIHNLRAACVRVRESIIFIYYCIAFKSHRDDIFVASGINNFIESHRDDKCIEFILELYLKSYPKFRLVKYTT